MSQDSQGHQDPAAASGNSAPPTNGEIELIVVEMIALAPTYPVSELLGREVINDTGQSIGRIDDLLIEGDEVAFAILSVGGFLGIGAHLVVVAFSDLLIDDDEVVLPGATKEALKRMLVYDREAMRAEHTPLKRARPGVKDAGQVAQTAAGEPVPGSVADVTDGDR
jgi:sporulation protein YlmC with PRC-barrel domain